MPIEWTKEITCLTECAILPVEQDITEVEVAVTPISTIEVIISVDAHQIIEINFISSLILVFRQV